MNRPSVVAPVAGSVPTRLLPEHGEAPMHAGT